MRTYQPAGPLSRYLKASKEYICFICDSTIQKNTNYYYRRYSSEEMADKFEKVTGVPYICKSVWEDTIGIKLCSRKCLKAFNKWKYHKNETPNKLLNKKLSILVNKIFERRVDEWIKWKHALDKAKEEGKTWCQNCKDFSEPKYNRTYGRLCEICGRIM